jgi:hypothetical protein
MGRSAGRPVVIHVADRVDVDQEPDPVDQHHHRRQRIEQERDVRAEVADLHPRV